MDLNNSKEINKQYSIYKKNRTKLDFIELNKLPSQSTKESQKFAIIVPFRDPGDGSRNKQKQIFIKSIKELLGDSNTLVIFSIQSADGCPFNRGALLNIGTRFAFKNGAQWVIHHDVDLIPSVKTFELYKIPPNDGPIHIGWLWKDKYTFKDYLGGILSISEKHMRKINGYPNHFWGWGGEDDALYNRLVKHNIKVFRPTEQFGKIKDIEEDEGESGKLSLKQRILKKKRILQDLEGLQGYNEIKYKTINKNIKKYKDIKMIDVTIQI